MEALTKFGLYCIVIDSYRTLWLTQIFAFLQGTEISLNFVKEHFPDMEILSLSGNFCADKKPAAVNW